MSKEVLHSASNASSSSSSTSENNDFAKQESGFQEGNSPGTNKFNLIRWKSGKSVDPRLFTLLEFFQEIYDERREFFRKIFPELYEEFVEVFKKIGAVLSPWEGTKAQTMQRSLSFGSSNDARKQGEESTLRLERFKVKTPFWREVQEGGHGGQGSQGDSGTKPIDSK